MSAVNATPEIFNHILSGKDIALTPKVPAADLPVRRTPLFETESGKRLIEGAVNLFRNAIPPILGMVLFVAVWALVSNSGKTIPDPAET